LKLTDLYYEDKALLNGPLPRTVNVLLNSYSTRLITVTVAHFIVPIPVEALHIRFTYFLGCHKEITLNKAVDLTILH